MTPSYLTTEYDGVVADRRLHTRKITGLPKAVARRIVQLQDELAFHKQFTALRAGSPDADPPVVVLRQLIEAERGSTLSAEKAA
jgi:hypothetical protein